MDLQELLEVEVGDLLTILRTEELRQARIGDDAALEVGVEAAVRLDIRRHELRDIRLRALRLGGQAHEARQLIGDGAELEERVVRAAGLVGRALLSGHRRGVLAHAALGITGLTLHRLRSIGSLAEQLAHAGRDVSVQGADTLLDRGEESIGRASLNRRRERGGSRRGRGRHDCGDRRSDRDLYNCLGGRRLLGGGGLGGGRGLLVGRHLVCINGGL